MASPNGVSHVRMRRKVPVLIFWVCFKSSETSDVLPACGGLTAKSAHADYALGLIPSSGAVDYK